jgi:homoserine O-acetyltransferase
MIAVADHEAFDLGPLTLQRGLTLPKAHIVYKTYGTLAPTSRTSFYPIYGAHHTDIDWLIGRERVLDSERYFVVIPNQFGNGLSTSPSNLAEPFGLGRNPLFTHWDNVHAQERLLREKFGVTRLALVYGWSMGGQQALHWGALFPDRVARICAVCTSARTSPHNKVFLEGIRATLTADAAWRDGCFVERPVRALRAFARVYAGWAMSQAFYRERLWERVGFASLEDYLVRAWEGNFLRRNGEDLLSMIDTWYQSDISDNTVYNGTSEERLARSRRERSSCRRRRICTSRSLTVRTIRGSCPMRSYARFPRSGAIVPATHCNAPRTRPLYARRCKRFWRASGIGRAECAFHYLWKGRDRDYFLWCSSTSLATSAPDIATGQSP